MFLFTCLFVELFLHAAFAVPWNEAPQTSVVLAAKAPAPRPTEAPQAQQLLKRYSTDTTTPDELCGYVTGDKDSATSCNLGSTCLFDSVSSAQGCCTASDCSNMYTSCVPNSGTCDGDCMMDSKIRYCGSAYPHCYTQNFVFEDEHFTGVGCTDTYGISEYIYPTHTKGTSGPLPAQSTPTSEPADDSDDSGGTTINGGAIAGGVIGGVLAVAGVGGFIIWLITRKLPGENGGGPSTQEQLSEYKFGQSLATSSMAPSDSRSASDAHMFAGVHEVSATSPLPPGVYEVSGDIYKPSGNQTVTELQ